MLPAKDLTISRYKSDLLNNERVMTHDDFVIMGNGAAFEIADHFERERNILSKYRLGGNKYLGYMKPIGAFLKHVKDLQYAPNKVILSLGKFETFNQKSQNWLFFRHALRKILTLLHHKGTQRIVYVIPFPFIQVQLDNSICMLGGKEETNYLDMIQATNEALTGIEYPNVEIVNFRTLITTESYCYHHLRSTDRPRVVRKIPDVRAKAFEYNVRTGEWVVAGRVWQNFEWYLSKKKSRCQPESAYLITSACDANSSGSGSRGHHRRLL